MKSSISSCLLWSAFLALGNVNAAEGPAPGAVVEQDRHWDEAELAQSVVDAIRSDESTQILESCRAMSKTELNTALILACRLGKLESAKALVAIGAEPSFVIERHPAAGKVSPLFYAIKSDNLNLVTYLLAHKGALHFERSGDSLELGMAAGRGRVEATIRILDALLKLKPSRYQQYIKSAIVVMIWNKQEAAAIQVISRYRDYLPESSLPNLRKAVAASDGPSSLRSLENAWRAAHLRQPDAGVTPNPGRTVALVSSTAEARLGSTIDDFRSLWGPPSDEETLVRTATLKWNRSPANGESSVTDVFAAEVAFLDGVACEVALRSKERITSRKLAEMAKPFLTTFRNADFAKPKSDLNGSRIYELSEGNVVLVNKHERHNVIVIMDECYLRNQDVFDGEAAKVRPPTSNH